MYRISTIISAVLNPVMRAEQWHMERGTLLHTLMQKESLKQAYSIDDPDNIITPYIPCIKKFWLDMRDEIEVLATEEEVKSERLQVIGHLDLRCKYKRHHCVLDYKSNQETWTAKYQLGGYGLLCRENNIDILKGYVVELHNDGTYKLKAYDMAWYMLEFRSILNVFNLKVREKQIKEG